MAAFMQMKGIEGEATDSTTNSPSHQLAQATLGLYTRKLHDQRHTHLVRH